MPPTKVPPTPPAFTQTGRLIFALFLLSIIAAGLSTSSYIKRIDLPPPGTYIVLGGQTNPLFVKLAQKSIKGLHRATSLHGSLAVPGSGSPVPIEVRSRNSMEWERKIKIPPIRPGKTAADLESNVAVLLDAEIPADPKLYGQIVPATFELEMVVPRIDTEDPKKGQAVSERLSWTMQLRVEPPGFLRLYQKINIGALSTAGAMLVIGILRIAIRRLRSSRKNR
jgi:hypothetical protein